MSTPKILILGAGYGGLLTTLHLQKKLNYNEAEITLVNKHNYHYITTWLHEPAAGTAPADHARVPLDQIIDMNKINFVKDTVQSIQPEERTVTLDSGNVLSYDYLVIGLGSDPETFGIEGLKEYAFSIRSINAVRQIREHIEYMFAKYKNEPHRTDYLTFVVGGAGFTGIEFSGELADRIPELCQEFDVDPSLVKIYNIEAAPTALPGFDPELVSYAVDILQKKGVEFMIGTAIKQCTPEGVVLANGEEIKAATVVWAAGVRGNSIVEKSGFEVMRGRVKVDEFLRAPGYDNVFVVGDCALIFNDEGRPYPPTAQIAVQEGEALGDNLAALIRGEVMMPFKPALQGSLASLGKGEGIGMVGTKKLFGTSAALMKKASDLRYLYKIGGVGLALKKVRL
ncbi:MULTISPECIES: NAD(P)/FAD-dependent oxidoreductase [Brevibacillus]|uniref:NADH dehydrogenase n=1 Tax=Brevibacillus borstelensis AK1 TaxID=1300222 RepID=M8DXA4_9BACL|nr:NAD(P)/FAD-dependent oxidoreductase [Brevibacillus borstelensis]EMT51621.1 NADH dehydrogenase [Brevibacillus borstelensis AK1]KKX56601.1 NADH dehydrogenase [Brevibacillus borstelensis cifa_chp40]MBE5397467.1 NAD(P)/FAD-dependent oxidoreductase [Brevibacillus borstelensis]MCC0562877.1 NAD(P)/FAD-dependent oxidoreductase [Brevibacillus borstelensis]MCM3470326.1 NAD(P)/FAD-dependent oxidoreductase [Brevibacillus borstelensis]